MITPQIDTALDLVDARCPRGHLLGRYNPAPAGVTIVWCTVCDRCPRERRNVIVELRQRSA